MDIARNKDLITVIQVYIAGGGDEQFIHRTVNHLAAQDMAERMQDGCNLNSDGKDERLIEAIGESELCVEQVDKEMKAEEDDWSQPFHRGNKNINAPKSADANAPDSVYIFDDAVLENGSHFSSASCTNGQVQACLNIIVATVNLIPGPHSGASDVLIAAGVFATSGLR